MHTATDQIDYAPAQALLPVRSQRLQSLDAYRGLIMLTLLAGSIFQSLKHLPAWELLVIQNEHSDWAGCTYWDLIQPSFMFMVGVAMPFAFARRSAAGDSWARQFLHVLLRAVKLILVGWLLDHYADSTVHLGFIRVLQQIAFGYVVSFFLLGRSYWTQGIFAGVILVGYNILWMHNRFNGPGGPWATSNENIGSVVDLWMVHRYYHGFYVGINAIPETANMIFGVMAGQLLLSRRSSRETMLILFVAGMSGIALGLGASYWLPLIKRIWTPSFAVFSTGWTMLILLFFYTIIEVIGWKRWAFPLVVVGMNSIAAYVIGNLFSGWFRSLSGAWVSWAWIHWVHRSIANPWYPVLQHALFAIFAWGVLYWLYRRKIFFKL